MCFRVPGYVMAIVHDISLVSARAKWSIFSDSFDCFLRDRTDADPPREYPRRPAHDRPDEREREQQLGSTREPRERLCHPPSPSTV